MQLECEFFIGSLAEQTTRECPNDTYQCQGSNQSWNLPAVSRNIATENSILVQLTLGILSSGIELDTGYVPREPHNFPKSP